VSEDFRVQGFSIVGKVTNTLGQGIEGVKLLIDGIEKIITGPNGEYKLDEIDPGRYILEGVHSEYIFEPLDITINPQLKKIPDLVVSEYRLCGQI